MTTFSGVYPSKTSWQLQLDVLETSLDAVGNQSYVTWSLYIYRGNTDGPYNNAGSSYTVTAPGGVSGTFGAYRFGSSGTGTDYSSTAVGGRVLIATAGAWVAHNADGTGSVTVSASHAAAATLGTGSIGSSSFPLTTLVQVPGVPGSVAATYNSDTQVTVAWADTSASNGQPASDQIETSVNNAAFTQVASISPATSLAITAAANEKIIAKVRATNSAGSSAWSASANTVFTTPAAPSGVVAAKNSSLNIVVSWTPNVAYTEYQHIVEHGTITGGVTTWDGSPLATVASGTTSYTHVAPSTSFVHVYRVSAQNTDVGALQSAKVLSNSVQLLAAPNAPTLPTLPAYADKAAALTVTWTHNPVDTTPQTAYEFEYSTDGGTTWSTTGKVTSTVSAYTIAASTYAANVAVTVRVRDWGQATTGGSDGTGASPWSTLQTVTFKTEPVATITTPANASTYVQSALTVVLGFSQAESATFVTATIQLLSGSTLLETKTSTTLAGTLMSTPVANGSSYTVKATVTDSNGLTSTQVSSTFTVTYTLPVPAVVTVTYLSDEGIGQIGLTVAAPGVGQAAASTVTITRTIGGVTETVIAAYPVTSLMTILDMTPTISGVNDYTVTTYAVSGASSAVTAELVTAETVWAFLSTGASYATIVNFFGDLTFSANPARATSLVKAADREQPIALFGTNTTLEISGTATLIPGDGSSSADIEAFILAAGKVCYRDSSGRRIFGVITATVDYTNSRIGKFTFKVAEAS